jgi:hypothetical protein
LGEFFHVRLAKFSLHESEATMDKYGHQRDFPTAQGVIRMEKHFTIGKRDSEGCIQLYWEFLADGGIVVGYVGPHLDYNTMR